MKPTKRWVTGYTAGHYFKIHQSDLKKLPSSLAGTKHLKSPPGKEKKRRMNFWYDLEWLLSKFSLVEPIPEHLIK